VAQVSRSGRLVIGCDSLIDLDGRALGKPASAVRCRCYGACWPSWASA
jgi:predicted house-cleaning NTP pyrophosphatase (Maf/HAM1 superfamily)